MSPFDKLDAAMDAFDERKAAAKRKADAQQVAADHFTTEFSNLCVTVVHPMLEQIGNHLRMRGHEFRVELIERERRGVTLHVFPAGTNAKASAYGGNIEHPSFSIFGDSGAQKVKFHSVIKYASGGGQSGSSGECTLSEATAEVIRDKAIDCIAKSLGDR